MTLQQNNNGPSASSAETAASLWRRHFDKIILDMDGVVTSEYIYWEAAALTVYELLYSHTYYGCTDIDREWCRSRVAMVYDTIFCGGQTVRAVKRLGVNTNWDLTYVVFCVSRYLEPNLTGFDSQHFESVCMFIENMTMLVPEVYVGVEGLAATVTPCEPGFLKRGGSGLWKQLKESFQRWFHGDPEIEGLKTREEPVLPLADIDKTLRRLTKLGIRLGVGTGRPRREIIYPLEKWGLYSYFDPQMFVSYDEVQAAEAALHPSEPLAKPHPFVFLKAALGEKYSDRQLVDEEYDRAAVARTLVVGDAPSDLMAARAGGFPFAAVLTGVEGAEAREYFEENRADLILNTMTELGEEYANQTGNPSDEG